MEKREYFFSNYACEIYYNTELKAVETKWSGVFIQKEEFRATLDKIIELISLKKTPVVIADAREMRVISTEDQKWIVDSWYPRAVAAGFRFEALIVSQYSFNERSIKKIVNFYDETKITTSYFYTFDKAAEWIKEIAEVKSD